MWPYAIPIDNNRKFICNNQQINADMHGSNECNNDENTYIKKTSHTLLSNIVVVRCGFEDYEAKVDRLLS